MPELIRQVAARAVNSELFLVGMVMLYVTGLVLLVAAALKFHEHAKKPQQLAKRRDHFFSTREMAIGVLVLFPFWLNSIAQLPLPRELQYAYFAVGALMIAAAVAWHVRAKIDIRRMWSDGIEIKREHQLVTSGAYALARHPMYAALLLWCWGAGVMMFNWASLAIVTLVLLPLMTKRATDEEAELIRAQPDYLLYQRNAPMLTPRLDGTLGLLARGAAAALFAYNVVVGLTASDLLLLCSLHVYLSFCLGPEKVAFSYRSKAGLTVLFWMISQVWQPAYYFLYVILAMFIYGLRFNCPCMIVYDRYHGCPCYRLLKSCIVRLQV
jgi:protein-S-isoprenylcysteine O-methyltransferase Ste14